MGTKWFYIFILTFTIVSCAEYVEKPNKKLSKDEMVNIIVDLSINSQMLEIESQSSPEEETYAIFKKYKISGKDFRDNYTYYLSKKEIPKILDKAQKKIKEMHPKAEQYIQEQNKINTLEQRPE